LDYQDIGVSIREMETLLKMIVEMEIQEIL
jgi:hypothetical protein